MFSGRVMISISTRDVRHPHTHIRIFLVAEAVTSPSSSVNALANDHPVNFTRRRKFHWSVQITRNNISLNL